MEDKDTNNTDTTMDQLPPLVIVLSQGKETTDNIINSKIYFFFKILDHTFYIVINKPQRNKLFCYQYFFFFRHTKNPNYG